MKKLILKVPNKISGFIRGQDQIMDPSVYKLHFNNDTKMRTLGGGIITLFVAVMVARIFITNTVNMVTYDDPTREQLASDYKDYDEKIPLKNVTKTTL